MRRDANLVHVVLIEGINQDFEATIFPFYYRDGFGQSNCEKTTPESLTRLLHAFVSRC